MTSLAHTAPGDLAPCRAAPDWQPRCIKLPAWPERYQRLWATGCAAGSPFEPGEHGARLRLDSLRKVTKGYGAWLSFLQAHGWLDESQPAAERVTRQRLVAYFRAMQRRGQAGHTIAGRFGELRSMSLLRIGPEFTRIADGYRVELQPEQVKTGKYDVFTLPKKLTHFIDQYLATVRPALLRGKRHDALWIGINGKPLERKGIEAIVGGLSKARFGVTFGPHSFRHAIATTAPLRAPEHPGLAAPLLGISKEVVETHYNRSQQVSALRTFQGIVENWEGPLHPD